jgi:hypothetical protein
MVSPNYIKDSPLYEKLHVWYREEISNKFQREFKCLFCQRIIATQNMSHHLSRSVCPSIRVDIDPKDRPLIRLIFQDLKKRYSSSKKDYWMDLEEQSWLKFRYIVGYCHEGRLKHWMFKKFDGGLQWISNVALNTSKLGQSIIRYANRHIDQLLELDKPVLNEKVLSLIDGKNRFWTLDSLLQQSGYKNRMNC